MDEAGTGELDGSRGVGGPTTASKEATKSELLDWHNSESVATVTRSVPSSVVQSSTASVVEQQSTIVTTVSDVRQATQESQSAQHSTISHAVSGHARAASMQHSSTVNTTVAEAPADRALRKTSSLQLSPKQPSAKQLSPKQLSRSSSNASNGAPDSSRGTRTSFLTRKRSVRFNPKVEEEQTQHAADVMDAPADNKAAAAAEDPATENPKPAQQLTTAGDAALPAAAAAEDTFQEKASILDAYSGAREVARRSLHPTSSSSASHAGAHAAGTAASSQGAPGEDLSSYAIAAFSDDEAMSERSELSFTRLGAATRGPFVPPAPLQLHPLAESDESEISHTELETRQGPPPASPIHDPPFLSDRRSPASKGTLSREFLSELSGTPRSRRGSDSSAVSNESSSRTMRPAELAANQESPWGVMSPSRLARNRNFSLDSPTSRKATMSPRLRGVYAEIQVKEFEQQLTEAKQRVIEVTEQLHGERDEKRALAERIATLEQQLEEARELRNSPTTTVKTVVDKLMLARDESRDLASQVAQLDKQVDLLRREAGKQQRAMDEREEQYQQEQARLQAQLEEAKSDMQAKLQAIKLELQTAKDQNARFEEALSSESQSEQMASLNHALQIEISSRLSALAAVEVTRTEAANLQEISRQLQAQLAAEAQARQEAEGGLAEAYKHCQELEERLTQAERNLDNAEVQEKLGLLRQVKEANDQSASVQQQVDAMTAQLEAGRQETSKLKAELAQVNDQMTRLDEAAEKSAESLQPHITHTQPKERSMHKRAISITDDRVDSVISQLESMNSTLKQLRTDPSDPSAPIMGSIEQLASELETERQQRVDAEAALHAALRQAEDVSLELRLMREQQQAMLQMQSDAAQDNARLERELRDAEAQLEGIHREKAKLASDLRDAASQLEMMRRSAVGQKDSLAMQEQLQHLEHAHSEAVRNLEEVRYVESQMAGLQFELEQALQQARDAEAQLIKERELRSKLEASSLLPASALLRAVSGIPQTSLELGQGQGATPCMQKFSAAFAAGQSPPAELAASNSNKPAGAGSLGAHNASVGSTTLATGMGPTATRAAEVMADAGSGRVGSGIWPASTHHDLVNVASLDFQAMADNEHELLSASIRRDMSLNSDASSPSYAGALATDRSSDNGAATDRTDRALASLPKNTGIILSADASYAETVEKLLSELWKERLARQRAEIAASDNAEKLTALAWAAAGEKSGFALAPGMDEALMLRLEEERNRNSSLIDVLQTAQVHQESLQSRVRCLEAETQAQEMQLGQLHKLAKRHIEGSMKHVDMRRTLQRATAGEEQMRQKVQALENELAAARRVQRDSASHFKSTNAKLTTDIEAARKQAVEAAAALKKEAEHRRRLEGVLEEGSHLQKEIFSSLQELLKYLHEEGHLNPGQADGGTGAGGAKPDTAVPANVTALLQLLQEAQAKNATAAAALKGSPSPSRAGSGVAAQLVPRTSSGAAKTGADGKHVNTIEQGVGPVELASPLHSARGKSLLEKAASLVPGRLHKQASASPRQLAAAGGAPAAPSDTIGAVWTVNQDVAALTKTLSTPQPA